MVLLRLLKPRMTWVQCSYGMFWVLLCLISSPPATQLMGRFVSSSNAYNLQAIFSLQIYVQAIQGTSKVVSDVFRLPLAILLKWRPCSAVDFVRRALLLHLRQLLSGLIGVVGEEILSSLDTCSSKAWCYGAQVPLGLGCGIGNQIPVTVVQSFSRPEDMATATGTVFSD